MEKSLKEVYGVNLQNNYNRYITQQWDQAQRKVTQYTIYLLQGWFSSRKKGISSLPMGRNGFLPERNPFFWEEVEETGKKLSRDTVT